MTNRDEGLEALELLAALAPGLARRLHEPDVTDDERVVVEGVARRLREMGAAELAELLEPEGPPLAKLCPGCGWMPIPDHVALCWPCALARAGGGDQ